MSLRKTLDKKKVGDPRRTPDRGLLHGMGYRKLSGQEFKITGGVNRDQSPITGQSVLKDGRRMSPFDIRRPINKHDYIMGRREAGKPDRTDSKSFGGFSGPGLTRKSSLK